MPTFIRSLFAAGMIAAGVALGLAGCGPQPTYQVVQTPAARVGTVDKFQGQEAPIAIYSTASSSQAA